MRSSTTEMQIKVAQELQLELTYNLPFTVSIIPEEGGRERENKRH